MSDSRVAGGLERLPWLSDDPVRRAAPAKGRRGDLAAWAGSAVLVAAGVSFWLGSHVPISETAPAPINQPSATVTIPQPRSAPAPEVRLVPQPEVARVPEPQVSIVREPEIRIVPMPGPKASLSEGTDQAAAPTEAATEASTEKSAPASATAPSASTKAAAQPALKFWPARVITGAYGRLVQIGAYGSTIQAKQGWAAMARAYPALQKLPAVVVTTRNSKGRVFYRFQIGTTSQAHSEVLCQRMEKIELSCAIIGLPWKPKIER